MVGSPYTENTDLHRNIKIETVKEEIQKIQKQALYTCENQNGLDPRPSWNRKKIEKDKTFKLL